MNPYGIHRYGNPYATHTYGTHPYTSSYPYSSNLYNPSVLGHPLAHRVHPGLHHGYHHHRHALSPYAMGHPYIGSAVDPLVTVHPNGYHHGHHHLNHHLGLSPYRSPVMHTALVRQRAPPTKQELEILNARVEAEKITSKAR